MADKFSSHGVGLSDPGWDGAAVTPDNDTDLSTTARALYIGTTGNLKIDTAAGTTLTFNNVPVGWFVMRTKRVHSTGTTASNIIAVW